VRLHFDSPNVPGWNEVDAVGLVAKDGTEQYAVAAQASSIYGGSYPSGAPTSLAANANLIPSWAGIAAPIQPSTGFAGTLTRPPARKPMVIAEARGWPMLALAGHKEFEPAAVASPNSGVTLYPGPYSGAMSGSFPAGYTGAMPSPSPYTSLALTGSLQVGPTYPDRTKKPIMLYRPIPLGLAVNTVLAALALWLIYAALTVPRRFLLEVSRLRRGCCVLCGYDVGYDFVAGCPECGWNRGITKTQTLSFKNPRKLKEADPKDQLVTVGR
jgi:hypothetical protein